MQLLTAVPTRIFWLIVGATPALSSTASIGIMNNSWRPMTFTKICASTKWCESTGWFSCHCTCVNSTHMTPEAAALTLQCLEAHRRTSTMSFRRRISVRLPQHSQKSPDPSKHERVNPLEAEEHSKTLSADLQRRSKFPMKSILLLFSQISWEKHALDHMDPTFWYLACVQSGLCIEYVCGSVRF